MKLFGKIRLTTFQIIVFGFIGLILAGALLLLMPVSSRNEGSADFMDCLFTATSAVCVTGLVVQDTGTWWSPFGQAVILMLIQIGGLGVVTAAASLAFVSGKKIGLMQRSLMQESISAPQVGGIVRLTRFILIAAFCMEAAGAVLMLPVMIADFGLKKGIWYAAFHSISAFCNAGFDLMGAREAYSSLTGYSQNVLVNLTVICLIVSGGIGFLVWNDLKEHGLHWKAYRMQSKAVLTVSGILILIPALWFFFFEMKWLPAERRILPAIFQSVTLRTAGFNTEELSGMSEGGQLMMILLMLVGGSPGSTAGGMKTTTVAVLLMTAAAVFRRREEVHFFGRRVSGDAVRNAATILLMYLTLFTVSGMAISRIEGLPLLTCLFETASAVGTVGLTLGITGQLSAASRIILILLMFMGRVGGLTLIYAAQAKRAVLKSTMPLEKITVG